MSIARGIEKRLENLVDGVSASVFRGRMHPVTMASKLVRQLEFLATKTEYAVEVPNALTVVINPADLDPDLDVSDLEEELSVVVDDAALQSGWKLVGPADIHLATAAEVPRGILQVAGDAVRGPLPPWGQLIADDGSAVIPLTMNCQLVGRALDCDIRLSNSEVSRHHAVIERSGDRVAVRDLASSNGTAVNGDRISVRDAVLLPGSHVAFGQLPFTYRPVS